MLYAMRVQKKTKLLPIEGLQGTIIIYSALYTYLSFYHIYSLYQIISSLPTNKKDIYSEVWRTQEKHYFHSGDYKEPQPTKHDQFFTHTFLHLKAKYTLVKLLRPLGVLRFSSFHPHKVQCSGWINPNWHELEKVRKMVISSATQEEVL